MPLPTKIFDQNRASLMGDEEDVCAEQEHT